MASPIYNRIGGSYTAFRQPDARIADVIHQALGEAQTVLNVGAGTGAYEPEDRDVVAVEPSEVMISQRPEGAAPVVQASAEALPFPDDSFDVVMALISDHHWTDRHRGLTEMRRVARRRVVILNSDPGQADLFWLNNQYLPEFFDLIGPYREPGLWASSFERALGPVEFRPVLIPHDCTDGFYPAYWRRPEAYLDPAVRAGISVFSFISPRAVTRALKELRADLTSGTWLARNHGLHEVNELDLGMKLVTCKISADD